MGRAFEVRKFKMEKTSQAKTKIYSKYGREIFVAAKQGQDPALNSELQRIIDKAKRDQVPNDIIERAIKKATNNDTENYTHIIYEGFGPNGSNLIVSCLSDNNNRTYTEVRNYFNKSHSKLGVNGSVMHLFNHQSVFLVESNDEEKILEIMLDNNIDISDISREENEVEIFAKVQDFANIKKVLKENNIKVINEVITYLPLNEVQLNGEDMDNFKKLYELLENDDDVQDIYHNVSNFGG